MCPFDYTAVAGSGKVGPVNQVNHTSWVAVVTPTERPKSVRDRCLIELFCGVVCAFTLPFWHFRGCWGFCHRTESDLLLFVFKFCLHASKLVIVSFFVSDHRFCARFAAILCRKKKNLCTNNFSLLQLSYKLPCYALNADCLSIPCETWFQSRCRHANFEQVDAIKQDEMFIHTQCSCVHKTTGKTRVTHAGRITPCDFIITHKWPESNNSVNQMS